MVWPSRGRNGTSATVRVVAACSSGICSPAASTCSVDAADGGDVGQPVRAVHVLVGAGEVEEGVERRGEQAHAEGDDHGDGDELCRAAPELAPERA